MRLTCDVDIVNRVLPSYNMKNKSKACRSQLSIGHKPGNGPLKDSTLFLMLCTAKDKNGTKYLIKGNIERVFTKFVSEGKGTIRVKEPQHDICISKADVLQLKNFLSVLRLALEGKNMDHISLSSLAPAATRHVEKPKTNLVILTRKDYPITTNFPSSLTQLQIHECKMKRIDSRIFKLRHLIKLDLSHNCLESVPDDISSLTCLSELVITHNNLAILSPSVCLKSPIQKSLGLLDLSNNTIKQLPLQICELTNLVTLKLDHNLMEQLPPTIGRLLRLKFLSVCSNKLSVLPAGFLNLRLDSLDMFGNSFSMTEDCQVSASSVDVPTLMECTARSIRKQKVTYSDEDLHGHLCRYLDSARQCWCGNYCFQASVRYQAKVDVRGVASTVTAVDVMGGTQVPVDGFLCSPQCLNKFQKNPKAYWR